MKQPFFFAKTFSDLEIQTYFFFTGRENDFTFSKYMANERYRKWVHLPKGTMMSAH